MANELTCEKCSNVNTTMCVKCIRNKDVHVICNIADFYRTVQKAEKPLMFEELTHLNGCPVFEKVVSEFGLRNNLGFWRIVSVNDNGSCVIRLIGFGGSKCYFNDSDFKKDDIEIYRRPPEAGENDES